MRSKCAILYSGGTDSTAAAAVMAQKFDEVHLVTFCEVATANSPDPVDNIERLRRAFSNVNFVVKKVSVDANLKKLSYQKYFYYLFKYGLINLSTPGLSSLSWHTCMISYCIKNQIQNVADGLTRELMHFPGHQDFFVERARELYRDFNIDYSNPVREWPCSADFQFVHKLIIDFHLGEREVVAASTSDYLNKLKVFEKGNLKGSHADQKMQKDCYPFIVYNILVFWVSPVFQSRKKWQSALERFFAEKFNDAKQMLIANQIFDAGT